MSEKGWVEGGVGLFNLSPKLSRVLTILSSLKFQRRQNEKKKERKKEKDAKRSGKRKVKKGKRKKRTKVKKGGKLMKEMKYRREEKMENLALSKSKK